METTALDHKQFLNTLKTLIATLMGAPVLIGLALAVVLNSKTDPLKPTLYLVPVLLLALVLIPLTNGILNAIPPLTAEEDPATAVPARIQANTITRFAVCETVFFLALILAFLTASGGVLVVLLGVMAVELLLAFQVAPTGRILAKTKERLEANGVKSGL